MGNWYIVSPEYSKNLITNPSFELAATGWTAGAGSLARSTDHQRRGLYSGEYTPSSGTTDGLYFGLALEETTTYTFSVDVWAADGVDYQIYAYDVTAAALLGTATTFTGRDSWTRQRVTFATGANTDIRLYIAKNGSASVAPFYVDGAQCEAKGYATTYIDGDRDGCAWLAVAHASASERSAQYYGGGQVVDLEAIQIVSGQDRGFKVQEANGVGMPPVGHISARPALGDGGIFQRAYSEVRVIQLTGTFRGTSLENLPLHRRLLIDLINPDGMISTSLPLQLRYAGYDRPVAIDCYYDAGMEFVQGPGYVERATLRFMAYDPVWVEVIGTGGADSADNGGTAGVSSVGDTASSLASQTSLDVNYIIQRDPAGTWSNLDDGLDLDATALAVGPDDQIYVGGWFTNAGGSSANYVAVWDPVASTWSALGSGLNDLVNALAVGPDGRVYVGGDFTTAGGGSANYVAVWDSSTSTWSALGSGLNGSVSALAVGLDGKVYVGGAFTTAGGSSANRIAVWDPVASSWSALGSGLNGTVNALTVGLEGKIYVGGAFTTAGGSSANYIAVWDPVASSWSALGSGLDAAVKALAAGPEGKVYAGGAFTTAGGNPASNVAVWTNGSVWRAMGEGVDSTVLSIVVTADNVVFVGGDQIGILKFAGNWVGYEVDLPLTPFPEAPATVWAIARRADGTLIAGFNTSGTAAVTGISTINNEGSARAYPVFEILGPGRIYSIINYTTGDEIYMDLTLNSGETAILDLRSGQKTFVSSFRGNVIGTILTGSDVATFRLAPGENVISILIDDTDAVVFAAWAARHWSIDGVAS